MNRIIAATKPTCHQFCALSLFIGLLAASSASAAVIVNFTEIPDEGGIQLTGTTFDDIPFAPITSSSELFRIVPTRDFSDPFDFQLGHIGIAITTFPPILVNVLESTGGPISDQIYIRPSIYRPDFNGDFYTLIDFISDPALFIVGSPDVTMVETGGLQLAYAYHNKQHELVTINFQSDVGELVPEPSTIVLAGLGAVALAVPAIHKRRLGRKTREGNGTGVITANAVTDNQLLGTGRTGHSAFLKQ